MASKAPSESVKAISIHDEDEDEDKSNNSIKSYDIDFSNLE